MNSRHGVMGFPGDREKKRGKMLWTLPFLLFALWVLGLVTSPVLGGFVHIPLLAAALAMLVNITRGRKAQRAGIRH